jgi:hypothetical protein
MRVRLPHPRVLLLAAVGVAAWLRFAVPGVMLVAVVGAIGAVLAV